MKKLAVRCKVCGWTIYPHPKEWKKGYLELYCPNPECSNHGNGWRDTRKVKSIWEEINKGRVRGKLEKLLRQAAEEGVIKCPKCGNSLEPDAEGCFCGWENPLLELGYI